MADYRMDCCGGFTGHTELCYTRSADDPVRQKYEREQQYRREGFAVVSALNGVYYCRRGCGCLVWDVEAHKKNVCTEFNPIAG